MIIARQSTARTVTVGPVLDAAGVAVTDGVVADFKLSKNGGAPAALNASATLTHRSVGFYSLALTTSDTDTVGQAEIVIDDTVNACPMKDITVVEEAVYDALFAASALGYVANAPVNVAQFGGSNGTFASGRPEVNVTHLLGTAWLTPGTAGTPDVNVKLWNALATVALPLVPTTAGRTLDVSVGGEAGIDWANVGSPTTAVNLSGTTTNLVNTVTTYTGNTVQTGDSFARIGATGSGLTSLAPSSTALSTATWTGTLATNLGTLASHDPGATLGTSTLTQTQVTGGAYALNSSSFAFNTALDLTTTQKTSVTTAATAATPVAASVTAGVTVTTNNDKTGYSVSGTTTTLDALQTALNSAHGAGSWATATGFSTLTAADVNAEVDTALADVGLTTTITGRIDAAVTTRMATYAQPTGFLAATFPTDPADQSLVIAATDAILTAVGTKASQTSVDDLPTNAELATALAAADDATLAAIAALNNLSAAQVNAEVDTALADYDAPTNAELVARTLASADYATATAVAALPTSAELATALAAADDAVLAAIAALNNLSAAQVNAEVVDALSADTYAEPTGVPTATVSLAEKVGRLYKALMRGIEVTATAKTFLDASGTDEWKKTLGDDGTAYTEGSAAAP